MTTTTTELATTTEQTETSAELAIDNSLQSTEQLDNLKALLDLPN